MQVLGSSKPKTTSESLYRGCSMWTKAWQNARPGWTRRVRFFSKGEGMARLEFTERNADNTERQKHSITVDLVTAEEWYRKYAADENLTGRDIFFAVKEAEESSA